MLERFSPERLLPEDSIKCKNCKRNLPSSAFYTEKTYPGVDYRYWYRGALICRSCFNSRYSVCRKCRRHYDIETKKGNNLCPECFIKTPFCRDCGKELETYEVYKRGGVTRCAECDSKAFVKQGGISNGVVLTDSVDVIVFTQKYPCARHSNSVNCVTAYAIGIEDAQAHPINVFYCAECHLYYINSSQYLSFAKTYGLPLLKLGFRSQGTYGSADFSEWNQQSILNFLGYNVSSNDNLSNIERYRILTDCIDTEIMTKARVCGFLERMISLHINRENYEYACQKWETDLEAIRNYKINTQRKINARFVMKQYSGTGRHSKP